MHLVFSRLQCTLLLENNVNNYIQNACRQYLASVFWQSICWYNGVHTLLNLKGAPLSRILATCLHSANHVSLQKILDTILYHDIEGK